MRSAIWTRVPWSVFQGVDGPSYKTLTVPMKNGSKYKFSNIEPVKTIQTRVFNSIDIFRMSSLMKNNVQGRIQDFVGGAKLEI